MPQRLGLHIGEEMDARDQGVDARRQLLPRRYLEQRTVVADAEPDVRAAGTATGEVGTDEIEFGANGQTRRPRPASNGRTSLASLSSTPLT